MNTVLERLTNIKRVWNSFVKTITVDKEKELFSSIGTSDVSNLINNLIHEGKAINNYTFESPFELNLLQYLLVYSYRANEIVKKFKSDYSPNLGKRLIETLLGIANGFAQIKLYKFTSDDKAISAYNEKIVDIEAELDGIINNAKNRYGEFEAIIQNIKEADETTKKIKKDAIDFRTLRETLQEEFKSTESKIKNVDKLLLDSQGLVDKNKDLIDELEKTSTSASEATKKANLALSKSNSGLLGETFEKYYLRYGKLKNTWTAVFCASLFLILCAIIVSLVLEVHVFDDDEYLFASIVRKIVFLPPLIWLAWFSAVQYGNSLRMQEEYAFKMSLVSFFELYESKISDLKVLESGFYAREILTACFMQVLINDPVLTFDKSCKEASPLNDLVEKFLRVPRKDNVGGVCDVAGKGDG